MEHSFLSLSSLLFFLSLCIKSPWNKTSTFNPDSNSSESVFQTGTPCSILWLRVPYFDSVFHTSTWFLSSPGMEHGGCMKHDYKLAMIKFKDIFVSLFSGNRQSLLFVLVFLCLYSRRLPLHHYCSSWYLICTFCNLPRLMLLGECIRYVGKFWI